MKKKSWEEDRVQLVGYVPSKMKRGMMLAAAYHRTTVSALVEILCRQFLDECPEIKEILEREE